MKVLSFLVLVYYGKILVFLGLKLWILFTKGQYGGKNLLKKLKKDLFFKSLILLTTESLLELFMGGYVTLKAPIFTKFGEILSSTLAIFVYIKIFIVLPSLIIIFALIKKNYLG